MFGDKEYIKVIWLKENYKAQVLNLQVDLMASSLITKFKNNKRIGGWFINHQLMKPVYNVPGIQDGQRALIITSRDIIYDPLKQLDESWSKEKILEHLKEEAKEQQHKAEESGMAGLLGRSTMLLAGSAMLLFVCICIIGVLKYYRG